MQTLQKQTSLFTEETLTFLREDSPVNHLAQQEIGGGASDERFLWPEFKRAIREIEPCWVVAENVYGLLNIDNGLTAELVCSDLEDCGYEKPLILDCPNSAFGLPTMERHIWFISKAIGKRCERCETDTNQDNRNARELSGANKRESNGWNISVTRFCNVGERVSNKLAKHQRPAVKSGGNAISPQVALEIFNTIKSFEKSILQGR